MKTRRQKGIALPLVMLAIMAGAIVIPLFLGRVGANLAGTRNYHQSLDAEYACDSGAEHAVWNVDKGGLDASIPHGGDTTTYALPQAVNSLTPQVKVSAGWDTIASDDFESGGLAGGTGWLGNWSSSGGVSVTTLNNPYQGSYHLSLTGSNAVAARSLDLSQQVSVHLRFWARAGLFASGDTAVCRVSPDGNSWTAVQSWDINTADGIYHYYDLDIASYGLTKDFYISYQSALIGGSAYLCVDAVQVVWPAGPEHTIAADDFESGGWAGGSGWLAEWTHTGSSNVTANGGPYSGSYHMELNGPDGYAAREANLAGFNVAHLQFWAKVNNFESGDTATCKISTDGSNWTSVYTWTAANSDNTYHYYTIDLSSYNLTGTFWVAFSAGMDQANDYFYVDNVTLTGMKAYCITSAAGVRILKAAVDLTGGSPVILSWWFLV